MAPEPLQVVVIGAGPAGLTAAYELMKAGHAAEVTILESDTSSAGSADRRARRLALRHRRPPVLHEGESRRRALVSRSSAPENFLQPPAPEPHLYRGKLYDYPLVPMNALRNLGPIEAVRCVGSYVWVRIHPPKNQDNLEGFYAARFGWRLYQHFFKTYTEKVWGVPADELSADFGAQRVKDLSLFRAVVGGAQAEALPAIAATSRRRSRASSRSSTTRSTARG